MLETKIRPTIQKILIDPVAKLIATYIKPNTLTIISLIVGLLSGMFIALNWQIPAVCLLLLSGYLDILDGSVARLSQQSSAFGTVLDIMSDRTVEVIIVLGFALRAPEYAIVYLLMMGANLLCVSSFLVVGIFSANTSHKSFYYSPGLMERAEAFIFFIMLIMLPSWQLWLAILYILLVLWTAVFRLIEFYNNLRKNTE